MKIIVASTSPNRKKIFDTLGFKYEICAPNYEEKIVKEQSPINQIQEFAKGKAESVLDNFATEKNFVVIGFDSMIEFEENSLGKPIDRDDAFTMIKSFVGKKQNIVSGVALMGKWQGKFFESIFYVSSEVKFRNNITDAQINKFLDFGDWKGRCGSYAVSGSAQFLMESISGDFQNIIGVPVMSIGQELEKITGKNIFELVTPI